MIRSPAAIALVVFSLCPVFARAQEAVKPAANVEALFTDADPARNAIKQLAYHIEKDLLVAGHWDEAGKYLTDRYIQHNPNAASGLKGVIAYFTQVRKVAPLPIPARLDRPIVAVTVDGDLVTVVSARTLKDPKDPAKSYTTTWFDMWRVKDGKADEHWDPAERAP